MRVLQVVRQYFPSVGGMETAVSSICRGLRAKGHDCIVVTLNRLWSGGCRLETEEHVEGIRVLRIPFLGGRRFFIAPRVLSALEECDVAHVHGVDFFADFLAVTQRRHRKPFVVSTHGGYFHTRWAWPVKHLYFQTATRWALHVAHRVICTSQKDYRLFSQILPPEKLTVIGNGVDPFYFTVQKDVQPGLLVSVGRVSENKHIDRLIDMVSEISTQRPDAHLVLVGPYDHRLRSKLDARARERKVSDRVLFVGPAALAKVAHYLSNADVFVTASSYEAFGIALLEAMATGTIVVANDIEAFREVVAHGKSGFLVDFSDTSRAARVVSDAMTLSPSDRRSVGAGATEVAQARSWDRVVRTLERVYADVCDGRPEVCPDRARNCGGSGGGPGEG